MSFLTVSYGDLTLFLMPNYYSESGQRIAYDPAAERYPLRIEKDRPLVLDFSSKPRMVFRSPAEGEHIKAGQTIQVGVLLVEPKLDAVFRDIRSTAKSQLPQGQAGSLEPKVLITRANGEKVAEGVMPFG